MFMTVEKKVMKIKREDVNLAFLKKFWQDKLNRAIVLFVMEDESLATIISYLDFLKIEDKRELEFYINIIRNNKVWENCDEAEISDALTSLRSVTYLLLSEWKTVKDVATFAYSNIEAGCHEGVLKIKQCLEEKGIPVFRINFPWVEEIVPDRRTNCKSCYHLLRNLPGMGAQFPPYMDQITNLSNDQLGKLQSLWFQRLGRAEKKIFLVGPCIVSGDTNPPGERLGDILYRKLQEMDLGSEYEIQFVPMQAHEDVKFNNILEYDICDQDIVIIIQHGLYECELDLTAFYNSWQGEKWLYQDIPMHTTVTGNEEIAEMLIREIIVPVHKGKKEERIGFWSGEPQFPPTLEFEIKKYVNKIQNVREIPQGSVIGAIVMNCNPFTDGHRYLIEYAAKQVDYLYIFAVEEDLSVFPFYDRYLLIWEGIRDIPNVILVPSGRFIISRATFFDYFNKEAYTEDINAEEDVYIFARYIAKGLGITKRFVGEEPTDVVTNNYNQAMKEILPGYGIELIEIPRKMEGEHIISASTVRKMMEAEQWENIGKIVPSTTLKYLKENRETIRRRDVRKKQRECFQGGTTSDLINRICREEKVVIYSVGDYTRSLLQRISLEVQERFVYVDKIAENKKAFFLGKEVVPPRELLTTYKDYTIVVPTAKYGAEIYDQFVQMGVDLSRCIFNIRSCF